jgi:hypothetical protein
MGCTTLPEEKEENKEENKEKHTTEGEWWSLDPGTTATYTTQAYHTSIRRKDTTQDTNTQRHHTSTPHKGHHTEYHTKIPHKHTTQEHHTSTPHKDTTQELTTLATGHTVPVQFIHHPVHRWKRGQRRYPHHWQAVSFCRVPGDFNRVNAVVHDVKFRLQSEFRRQQRRLHGGTVAGGLFHVHRVLQPKVFRGFVFENEPLFKSVSKNKKK